MTLLLPLVFLINPNVKNNLLLDATFLVVAGILQHLLVFLIFRMPRFKNGMPFLEKYGSNDTGGFISMATLFTVAILSSGISSNDMLAALLLVFIICCGLTLFSWWKKRLYANYLEQLRTNELKSLNETIQEQQAKIDALTLHNDELAKIIHKDNKILPAMQIAVIELLKQPATLSKQSATLLTNLNELYQSRQDALTRYEQANRTLPKTSVLALDGILQYLYQRASKSQIAFDVTLSCSVNEFSLEETDICTLIADLGENAIIATKSETSRHISIEFSLTNSIPTISVLDSGIQFERNTIDKLGTSQITTHADTGGTGIGLMTTFELCRKYGASFIIEEYTEKQLYSKKISVCFDKQNEFRIFHNNELEKKKPLL